MLLKEKVKESLDYILAKLPFQPQVAVMLGSGLGTFAECMRESVSIPVKDIPHYPCSTVPGHAGKWIVGKIGSVPVLCIQGRVHYYEGYSLEQVTYPVHLIAGLGIKIFIVTNAAGGLNPDFLPGDFMLITDHINMGLNNPLIGKPENQLGPRFPDLSHAYDSGLIELAGQTAQKFGMKVHKGVFCWVTGPSYETAAEVKMLQKIGGDAVSMSTVPEVIVAKQRRLRVLGISLITNLATGLSKTKLTHQEVTNTAAGAMQNFELLITNIITQLDLKPL